MLGAVLKKIRKKRKVTVTKTVGNVVDSILSQSGRLSAEEYRKVKGGVSYTSNVKYIAAMALSGPRLKSELLNQLHLTIGVRPENMKYTDSEHGYVSVLMSKNPQGLRIHHPRAHS